MAEETNELDLNKGKGKGKKPTFDVKAMLDKHAAAGTIVTFTDRITCEIIEATEFYFKGQIIEPHKIVGEALIEQGIAKKVKSEED